MNCRLIVGCCTLCFLHYWLLTRPLAANKIAEPLAVAVSRFVSDPIESSVVRREEWLSRNLKSCCSVTYVRLIRF